MVSDNKEVLENIQNISFKLTKLEKIKRYSIIYNLLNGNSPIHVDDYQDLIAKNVLTLNCNGKIDSVYPFSITKTDKIIEFERLGKQPFYAMCAIDALGIYYLIGKSLTIESTCPISKQKIIVRMNCDKEKICSNLSTLRVLHVDLTSSSNWAIDCCSQMHFFINENCLEQWLLKNGCKNKKYYSLTLEEACKVAKKLFEFQ